MIGWWRDRSLREQRLLGLLGIIVAALLLWFAVVQPFRRAYDATIAARQNSARDLADVRAIADELARMPPIDARQSAGPLPAAARSAAESAGFTPSRVEIQDEIVILTIDAARPQPFFAWVAGLRGKGLVVDRLNAHPNADNTLAITIGLRRPRS
jgi:general secretion pathway protein M